MDPITAKLMSAAGAAADPIYVDDVFSTFLYDGNSTARSIVNGIDLSGEGGMLWTKARNAIAQNSLWDTERGTNNAISSNTTNAQSAFGSGTVTAFNSNGFSLGTGGIANDSAENYCSWTFRKCPGFFDIVTYTGNGSASGQTISHSLGSTPGSIWIKRTSASEDWCVFHRSVGTAGHVRLNTTANYTTNQKFDNVTSSSFDIVDDDVMTNGNGDSYVAYIFAHDDQSFGDDGDEAIIKCGTYTGTGTNGFPGNKITLGFEPQWLLIKGIDNAVDWQILDSMRGIYHDTSGDGSPFLRANLSSAEASNDARAVFLHADGFSVQSNNTDMNGTSGDDFIFIAIRRPHKPPEAATECFDVFTQAGSQSDQLRPGTSGSGVTDLAWIVNITVGRNRVTGARLTKNQSLFLDNDNAARTNVFDTSPNVWDQMSGTDLNGADPFSSINTSDDSSVFVNYHFTRKPGFMDVVTYIGVSASDLTVSHSLGVVPELMIVYNLSENQGSAVYVEAVGNTKGMFLSSNDLPEDNDYWNDTSPTATAFTLGNDNKTNNNGNTHVAYLFATLPGISKVGSYTGNGTTLNIDCGFTSGARFVLIKRTDANENWHLFDSVRGINSGNDPAIRLDTDVAPFNSAAINPLNAGFQVEQSASCNNNVNNGTYIFLAIA